MSQRKTIIISLVILLTGGAVTLMIFLTEPTAERGGATKETAMLVEVTDVERGNFTPVIRVTGTVEPSREIILSPRVSGEIISLAESFTPGGHVDKGNILLQIDPADYRNNLQLKESELRQAKSDLNIEMGRQDVARKDYQLFNDSLMPENTSLVLREPQLEAVRARVEAAEASMYQARLELQRTSVRAPFDAQIISRNANVGSQVSPGDDLGRLVGIDSYWVLINIPLSKISRLSFPDPEKAKGSEVLIRNRTAWQEGEYRKGYLFRLVGALEEQTRLARAIVVVPDPLAYEAENESLPKLIIGSFVEAEIKADEINNVIRLNRDYIRQNNTVWVMKNDKLNIREVEITFQDANYAYISDGLDGGEKIVISNLTTIVEGASLRLDENDSISGQSSGNDTLVD